MAAASRISEGIIRSSVHSSTVPIPENFHRNRVIKAHLEETGFMREFVSSIIFHTVTAEMDGISSGRIRIAAPGFAILG